MPATTPILADAGEQVACRPNRSARPRSTQAAELVQRAIDPGGNMHASKEFQRHLAGVLTSARFDHGERAGAA